MSDWMKAMQDKAKEVKTKIGSGQPLPFMKRLNLTGKNAAVKPGGQLILRLLPRWDIKDSYVLKNGKFEKNPEYKDGPVFFTAHEHWWDGDANQRVRIWCPTTFGDKERCPVCEESERLKKSHDPDDKKYGTEIARKEVFLFNAIIKDPNTKKRMLTEDGAPDIKVLVAHGTVFIGISDVMFGGGEEEFARGNITNVKEGYDIKLSRPAGGGGDRWKVDCAPNKSPLITDEERAAWGKEWVTLLINLPEWVKAEIKEYAELFKLYHGSEPAAEAPATAPSKAAPAPATAAAPSPAPAKRSKAAQTAPAPAAPAPEPEGDGFDSPPAAAPETEAPWGFDLN